MRERPWSGQLDHGFRFIIADMKTLILGLGNTIFGDDGVGIEVVREIKRKRSAGDGVEIVEASLGGMVLLDLITGFDQVTVVDAIITSDQNPAGFIYHLTLDDLGDVVQPYASHALDLKTTTELGRRLGYKMPDRVDIYAIKIEENTTFREGLTPPVRAAVPVVAGKIIEVIAANRTV